MKILVIATGVFNKGGIERYTRYQFAALQKVAGDKNVLLYSLLGPDKENLFEEPIDVSYFQGGISFKDKLMFVKQCLKKVRQEKIDLLIINHRQLSIIGYLCKKLFGTQYFTNVYGLEIWSGMNPVEKKALLASDVLVGDCNFILKYIKTNFSYPEGRLKLLFDPVDTQRFKPKEKDYSLLEKYNIPKDKFYVSTIGRLVRNKGHEITLKTLPSLPENIQYVVVGGGRQLEPLKKLAAELQVTHRVTFTGRVPEDELVAFYNLADIVVLLSVFDKDEGEGLPLGLIEASASGKPIICGNEDGSEDAFNKREPNGFLINPRSKEELKEAILKLHSSEELVKTMGDAGRKYVLNNFDFNIFTENQKRVLELASKKI